MVDLNAAWRMPGDTSAALDPVGARRVADELAELGVLWLEEPLDGADLRGLAALRATSRTRIAGGEMTRSLPELLAAIDADAYDVHQPDVVLAVAMLRARTVAELALARNRWFTPHTWTNGIGPLANLHVAAGVGGGPYLEFPTRPAGRRSAATSCSKSRSGSTGRGGSPSRACRAWESGSRRRPSGPSTRPPNRPRRRHPARATLWTQRDFLPPPQTRTR